MRVFGAAAATQPTNYRTNNIKSLMSNFACGPRTHTQHKQSFRKTRAAHTQHAKILTTTNFVLLSSSSRKPQGRTQRNAATRGHNVNMFFSVYGARVRVRALPQVCEFCNITHTFLQVCRNRRRRAITIFCLF